MRLKSIYDNQFQNEGIFLATLMEEPDFIQDTLIKEHHFLNENNRNAFRVMRESVEQGLRPNYHMLIQQDESTLARMGGFTHLTQIQAAYLTKENFKFQQDTILRFHAVEQVRSLSQAFLDETTATNDLGRVTSLLMNAEPYETVTFQKAESFSDKVKQRIEEHYNSPSEGISGINTGFDGLNRMNNGWQRGNLHIVAARPSVGKTAFAISAMRKSQQHNVFSTFFSLETPNGNIIDRMLASESRVNLMKIKQVNKYLTNDPAAYERYSLAVAKVEGMKMDVRDNVFRIPEMRSAMRENIKNNPGMDHVMFVDYLTLVEPPLERGDRRDLEVDSITNGLKSLAKEFNIAVVCLSQLSRGVENRQDKRPNMADLRDSGGIEQIADMISFLYRDDYQQQEGDMVSEVEFIIRKNRDGMTTTIKFDFNKPIQEYTESYG